MTMYVGGLLWRLLYASGGGQIMPPWAPQLFNWLTVVGGILLTTCILLEWSRVEVEPGPPDLSHAMNLGVGLACATLPLAALTWLAFLILA